MALWAYDWCRGPAAQGVGHNTLNSEVPKTKTLSPSPKP